MLWVLIFYLQTLYFIADAIFMILPNQRGSIDNKILNYNVADLDDSLWKEVVAVKVYKQIGYTFVISMFFLCTPHHQF
jgi:hypothetical protein